MRKVKLNESLLQEELKRHKQILEYTFISNEKEGKDNDSEKELLLGEEPETEEVDAVVDVDSEENIETPVEVAPEEMVGVPPVEPVMDAPVVDNSGDIELDITDLVQANDETKQSVEMVNQKMVDLVNQFNTLNQQLNKLEDLDTKLNDLEQEIVKRNPTEIEKLEMRSLDSFPYNQKLTDYWNEKEEEGRYQATSSEEEVVEPEVEYVLTQDEVDASYSPQDIKNSFTSDYNDDVLKKFDYFK